MDPKSTTEYFKFKNIDDYINNKNKYDCQSCHTLILEPKLCNSCNLLFCTPCLIDKTACPLCSNIQITNIAESTKLGLDDLKLKCRKNCEVLLSETYNHMLTCDNQMKDSNLNIISKELY